MRQARENRREMAHVKRALKLHPKPLALYTRLVLSPREGPVVLSVEALN